jgi:hypothetical protein
VFVIEDELHAELQDGEFPTLEAAMAELQRRAAIPWDQPPNVAPCMSWRTCGRIYEVIEYDSAVDSTRQIRRIPVLEVSAQGVRWHLSGGGIDDSPAA